MEILPHIFMISIIVTVYAVKDSAKDYGYFDYRINTVENCQGPKRKECCFNSIDVVNNLLAFVMDCREPVSVTKAKIVAFKSRQKLRLQMDKPCKHLFIKPIIMNIFNSSDACSIAKNKYHFNLDIVDLAQKYYGGMFLYGNWTFQSFFYSDDCNFLCMLLNVSILPKNEQRN